MKWYIDNAPKNSKVDPYVHLLVRILKQVRKHTDKGPKGQDVCGADIVTGDINADTPEGRKTILNIFLDWSPRLRNLFALVTDCIKRREKMVFWVLYPFEQILLTGLIRLCGASCEAFLAEMSNTARAKLGTRFNTKMSDRYDKEDLQFLVCSYAVGGVGLNLQAQCHMVVMVDHPMTHAIGEQAIGRCYRLGQKWDVHVLQLTVSDTFDATLANANQRRSLSLIYANIDQEALASQYHNETGIQAVDDEDVMIEDAADDQDTQQVAKDPFASGLDNFFMYNDKMVHGTKLTPAEKAMARPMTAQAVLCNIYRRLAGVEMDSKDVLSEEIDTEYLDDDELAEYMLRIPQTKPADIEGKHTVRPQWSECHSVISSCWNLHCDIPSFSI
jgi:hypothetical protein